MTEPLDPTIGLPSAIELADGLADIHDLSAELYQIDDTPLFDAKDIEVNAVIRLGGDRSFRHTPARRLFIDYRSHPDAYRHLDPLPAEDETLHGVISGKYALFELIPAIIERSGQPIADLHLATLSFSKQNAADILALLDDGHIERMGLLISYFFKAQNRPIYDSLIPPLRKRGHRVLAMRTHCKIILARMKDGTCYTVESSANLRSSVNIEQFAMTRSEELYRFHHDWIEGELLDGVELGKDEESTTTRKP